MSVEIIEDNVEYSCLVFSLTEKEKSLPLMHWIVKIHKNPVRFVHQYIENQNIQKNRWLCQLVVRFLPMAALAHLFLLLWFNGPRQQVKSPLKY